LISFFARRFIADHENYQHPVVRRRYGFLCGIAGVVINLLLFALKLFCGAVSGSIAITADAFNNLSDAGSSVVSLLGFKLAAQKPDKDHPFGHGRMEYVSALVVAALILLMGFELLQSSVEKILSPTGVTFSAVIAVILAVSVAAKIYMWSYNRAIGKKIGSAVLTATAADSLSDALSTAMVLLALIVSHVTDWQLDGILGLVVAFFVLRAGVEAARDTINPLLGQPAAPEFVAEVEKLVLSHREIVGIHDLIVHDYGPGRLMITLHAEVPAGGDLLELHDVVDTVENELAREMNCLATIHMDPISDDAATVEIRCKVAQLVKTIDENITIHDFRMVEGPTHTNLIFDALVPFEMEESDREIAGKIRALVERMEGNYFAVVTVEKSFVGE